MVIESYQGFKERNKEEKKREITFTHFLEVKEMEEIAKEIKRLEKELERRVLARPKTSNIRMGNIKDSVVSLELAKKLKEVGVKQRSIWFWIRWKDKDKWDVKCPEYMREEWKSSPLIEYYSAYTATELMEMLPSPIRECGEKHYTLCIYKDSFCDGYVVEYERWSNGKIDILRDFGNRKLADALAEMVIWFEEKRKKNHERGKIK